MSYCRFSSDNVGCDVYVYEDVGGGWTTHVAARSRLFPPIPDIPLASLPKLGAKYDRATKTIGYPSRFHSFMAGLIYGFWCWWHRWIHMGSLRWVPMRNIGLAHDGATFNDPTPGQCASRLEQLKALGYRVPSRTIEALRNEQAELVLKACSEAALNINSNGCGL